MVGPDQQMVVVRQDTPGISAACKLLTRAQQISFKPGHALVARPNVMFMFVAGAADEELSLSVQFQMRRRVKRVLMQTSVPHRFSLLFRRHFAIVVHDARTVENRCSEYNLQVASSPPLLKPGILHSTFEVLP